MSAHRHRRAPWCTLLALAGMSAGAMSWAQSAGEFRVQRSTVDSGGGVSTAAGFALTGTIGQPDVGAATGPSFEFQGGFWASSAPATTDVLLSDGFESP